MRYSKNTWKFQNNTVQSMALTTYQSAHIIVLHAEARMVGQNAWFFLCLNHTLDGFGNSKHYNLDCSRFI